MNCMACGSEVMAGRGAMETGAPVEMRGSSGILLASSIGDSGSDLERETEGFLRWRVENMEVKVEERRRGGGFRAFLLIREPDAAE